MGEVLRDYQREMLGRINEAWKSCRSVMVQMPTGTGKTYLMAEAIRSERLKVKGEKCSVLVVAHRRELIEQIRQTLDRRTKGYNNLEIIRTEEQNNFEIKRTEEHNNKDRGLALALSQSEATERTEGQQNFVTVTSIQKLARAKEQSSLFNINFSLLIIVDEAHHAVAESYRWMWDQWPEAKFLGLTATPYRLSGEGFTDLFDVLLQSESIQSFIEKGWLSDFEYVSVTPENWMLEKIHGLKKRGVDGDYQTKEMATVMDTPESIAHLYESTPESIAHLYESYEAFAWRKKGIVYAIDREHAKHIAAYYQSKGVRCAVIDAKTPAAVRAEIVERYKASSGIDVIVNVDIFSEGFDCPEVEFIQLARPTLSLSKYLQQVGRGMRKVPFKDCVTILDQVGLYQRFGLPTEVRDWSGMFLGQNGGRKGNGNQHHRLVLRDDQKDLTLLNLQMVRIRRSGEPHQHVEVFLENGRYGILKDGEVSCPAVFVRMRRAESPYFAVATYPFEVYHNRSTVIGEDGRDQNLKIYGKVEQKEDYIVYKDENGRKLWWDGKGGRNYTHRPGFEQIGGFDVVKEGKQYMLRKSSPLLNFKFNKEEVLVGPVFSIFKDVLVFNDYRMMFRIRGYQDNNVIVDTGRQPNGEMQVMADGSMKKVTYIPVWERWDWPRSTKRLGLRRLKTD